MKKKINILLFIIFGILLFNINNSKADGEVGIYIDETEHTVVFPYEKSFRAVVRMVNHSNENKAINVVPESEMPSDGHLLMTTGEYLLSPEQEAHCVIVFEMPENYTNNEGIIIPIKFSWDGGEEKYNFKIKSKVLPFKDKDDNLSEVEFEIYDKYNNDKIEGVLISAMLSSGLEEIPAYYNGEKYILELPSGNYLKEIKEEYDIDLENDGYFLQVSKKGYKNYLSSNFLPQESNDKRILSLEPLIKHGEYILEDTLKTGYSIWKFKTSQDGTYIAASQGAHGQEGIESPSYSKVLLMTEEGKKIWENETGGECWGVDISFDGQYIAAGCHDGKIYLWDKSGKKKWDYSDENKNQVRYVKFSPDSKHLMAGPVNGKSEESGIFDVNTGYLKWSSYTGDYLREGTFSSDNNIAYLDSANGIIQAFDSDEGDLLWSSNGDHYIPFIFDISEDTKQIFTAGKGKAFTAIELDTGKFRWQTAIDQTITAGGIAGDGSMVGVSVGGMLYKLNELGNIDWARLYGGVGHNGVFYTKNGEYILLGGPNPTLFDGDGNVLWQRYKNMDIEMTGPAEQWTGGANSVWMNEEASLLVLGLDDGNIEFYRGNIIEGENNYEQVIGPRAQDVSNENNIYGNFIGKKDDYKGNKIELPSLEVLIIFTALVFIVIIVIVLVTKMRKR